MEDEALMPLILFVRPPISIVQLNEFLRSERLSAGARRRRSHYYIDDQASSSAGSSPMCRHVDPASWTGQSVTWTEEARHPWTEAVAAVRQTLHPSPPAWASCIWHRG